MATCDCPDTHIYRALLRVLAREYRGTSLIRCGDFENACLFLKEIRNFSKNGCLFLKKLRNFSKNGCLFLIFFRPLPLFDVVSDQKKKNLTI